MHLGDSNNIWTEYKMIVRESGSCGLSIKKRVIESVGAILLAEQTVLANWHVKVNIETKRTR